MDVMLQPMHAMTAKTVPFQSEGAQADERRASLPHRLPCMADAVHSQDTSQAQAGTERGCSRGLWSDAAYAGEQRRTEMNNHAQKSLDSKQRIWSTE